MTGFEMAIAAIAASAVLMAVIVAIVVARERRGRAAQRFEAVLTQLDTHLRAVSLSLQRAVERAAEARARSVDDLELTVDFDELLRRVSAEAAARTGSEAAAIHIDGPGGERVTATFGAERSPEPPPAPLANRAGPFRAVTVNWTYPPGSERADDEHGSALVVPIVEEGVETGTLAVYAPAAGAFGADQIRALEDLAEKAGPAVANARRFADTQHSLTDALTGARNRQGYAIALEQAVASAHEAGLPLSLMILDPQSENGGDGHDDLVLQELASLLLRVTRSADVVARRGSEQFAVLLPATTGEAAHWLHVRLRELAARTEFPFTGSVAFAVGLAEWRPGEPPDSLDARASAATRRSRVDALQLVGGGRPEAVRPSADPMGRARFREILGKEITRARQLEQSLALLVMEVEAAVVGVAERALVDVERRIEPALRNGDAGCRIGDDELAVILPGSVAAEAEGVFANLRSSLEEQPFDGSGLLALYGGVTELAVGDGEESFFGRAEHALMRARRAGSGTVVVAMSADAAQR